MKKGLNLYQIMQVNKATHYQQTSLLPSGYKLLFSSDELSLSDDGYYGISAINQRDKQIIICNAGTKIDPDKLHETLFDIVSNIQIFNNEMPQQYKHALKFAQHSLEKMPAKYNITITGFSLGAVLADLISFQLSSSYPNLHSITFENPGSLNLINEHFAIDALGLSAVFKTYNSAVPNLVNIFGEQLGEYNMVCLDKTKFSDDMGKVGNAVLVGHAFKNFADGAFNEAHEIRLCGESEAIINVFDAIADLF